MNGCAVLYDADDMQYTIYREELALTERSPCSTFKIISSLIALENGIIQPDTLCAHGAERYSGIRNGIRILTLAARFGNHVSGITEVINEIDQN